MTPFEERLNQTDKSLVEARELLYELINYTTAHTKKWEQEREMAQRQYEALRQESEIVHQQAERERAELRRQLGDLTRKMGTIAESFVAPDAPRVLRQVANLPDTVPVAVNTRLKRLHPQVMNGQRQMVEIDAIAESQTAILMVEVKTTLRSEDVTHFLEVLSVVRDYFPEYAGRTIIGAVAGLEINPAVVTYASRQGLVVLALGDGLMSIQNEPGFQWRDF